MASENTLECFGLGDRQCAEPLEGDVEGVEGAGSEFPGFSWLVSSQMVTPLRARFWDGDVGPEFEVRFGISGIQVSQDELDKIRYRDGLPAWDSDWAVCLRS